MTRWLSMYRIGSLAALLLALGYLLFVVLVVVVLPAQGGIQVADFLDPARLLAKVAAHPQTVPTIVTLDLFNIGFGVLPFVILLALLQSIPQATRNARALVLGCVLINATLYLAAAAIDSGGLPAFVQLYQQQAQEAVTDYRVLETITLQLGNAAAASYGLSTVIVASVALRTQALSRPFLWLSLVWGAIALLSWPFIVIGAVGPLVGVIWSIWAGVVLWRSSQPSVGAVAVQSTTKATS